MIHDYASTNSAEKQLWFAVLGQLLNDFTTALNRRCYFECENMTRQMHSDHMLWICESCGIHPDRIYKYMKDQINKEKHIKPQNNIEFKTNKHYR